MLNSLANSSGSGAEDSQPRRALIINSGAASRLQPQLAVSGYETKTADTASAARAIAEFAPRVVLIELGRMSDNGGDQDCLALARTLRAEPATYALPLVFVFDEDERGLRNAALNVGADDYFSIRTPADEMLARLDALFWRAEAGRRAATVVGDQRLEIDNFILLLDSVRAAIRAGQRGTLALVYAVAASGGEEAPLDKTTRDRTLAEAHGCLKLGLRRIDEITFYGPTTLLVYLPRINADEAHAALSRAREHLKAESAASDIAIGLASFPADADEVESLIEKAEAAAAHARDHSKLERIVAHPANEEAKEAQRISPPPAPLTETEPASETMKAYETRAGEEMADESRTDEREIVEKAAGESESESAIESAGVDQLEISRVRQSTVAGQPVVASAPDDSDVSAPPEKLPVERAVGAQSNGVDILKAGAEAAARERELRAGGAIMPRRLLLTISDAARMAQINALIRSAGYEARAAFDGQQALGLLRIERPDLLLLDFQLDGIDGVETLRRLRKQNGGRLKLPVVLLLPPDHELARREAMELGAWAVVTMPCDPVELLTSVRLAGEAE